MRPFLFILSGQQTQTGCQGLVLHIRHDDGRPEEVIPRTVEGKERNHDHNRHNGRQDNTGEDLQAVGAVNGCRLIECLRDALHKVADEENVEHTADARPDEGVEVVDPAQCIGNAEHRQKIDHVREHGDIHQRPEDGVAALERETLIGIRCKRVNDHNQDHLGDGDDEGDEYVEE